MYVFTVPWMACLQYGQSLKEGAHLTQHIKWPQGKKTTPISLSMHILQVLASFSLWFSCSSSIEEAIAAAGFEPGPPLASEVELLRFCALSSLIWTVSFTVWGGLGLLSAFEHPGALTLTVCSYKKKINTVKFKVKSSKKKSLFP